MDKVYIEGLTFQTTIGFYQWEKEIMPDPVEKMYATRNGNDVGMTRDPFLLRQFALEQTVLKDPVAATYQPIKVSAPAVGSANATN